MSFLYLIFYSSSESDWCSEHWRPLLPEQVALEVPPDDGEGEKL